MILLCVGTTAPFNRLVRTLDKWAKLNPQKEITAQIGAATFHPENMSYLDFFPSGQMRDAAYDRAELLVCDLSVETIMPATTRGLEVLALPRLSIFGEEIGITQVSLAAELKSDAFIRVAEDEDQLFNLLCRPRTPLKTHANKPRAMQNARNLQSRFIKSPGRAG